MMYPAFIGLGANLGHPIQHIKDAVLALQQLPQTTLHAVSRLYGSTPVGPANQPDYVNAVALLHTRLTPHDLLTTLQAIENTAGRVRLERWGPRTLDLDILLYAQDTIRTPSLVIPHVELVNRCFVVQPLLDIQADLTLPDGTALAHVAAAHESMTLLADGPWWTRLTLSAH